jgi:hypothetical protein
MKAAALQNAIYARLNDASITALLSPAYGGVAIFTDVPQPVDAETANLFPFITYKVSNIAPFDTDTEVGGRAIVQVDCWHRKASDVQLNILADEVDLRLRRQPLVIAGVDWITTELESMSFTDDPDGKTKRALLLFSVLYLGGEIEGGGSVIVGGGGDW